LAGALTFYLGDLAIDRFGGEGRKRAAGGQDEGSGMAILLGTVLDGIPESIVLGLSLLERGLHRRSVQERLEKRVDPRSVGVGYDSGRDLFSGRLRSFR
jgi:hypothetical protein